MLYSRKRAAPQSARLRFPAPQKAYRFEHVHISAAAVALCCIIAVHDIVIFTDIVINDLLASSHEYIVDIPILCYLHALIYPEGIEERRSVNFVPKRRGSVISGEHFAASLNIIRQIYFFSVEPTYDV